MPTALELAKRLVPSQLKLLARTRRLGGHWRLRTADRLFLEGEIFPWIVREVKPQAVLDVGCDWYTSSYESLLGVARYDSLDLDPEKSRYASKRRKGQHHLGSLLELHRFVAPASYELVICNGVLGWGVNGREEVEQAAVQMAMCLRSGGWLIVGWNDINERRPQGMEVFERSPWELASFGPSQGHSILTATKSRHTFCFFRKEGTSH